MKGHRNEHILMLQRAWERERDACMKERLCEMLSRVGIWDRAVCVLAATNGANWIEPFRWIMVYFEGFSRTRKKNIIFPFILSGSVTFDCILERSGSTTASRFKEIFLRKRQNTQSEGFLKTDWVIPKPVSSPPPSLPFPTISSSELS